MLRVFGKSLEYLVKAENTCLEPKYLARAESI